MLLVSLLLVFSVAYHVDAQGAICTAGEYDIQPLLNYSHWRVELSEVECADFFENQRCTLYMAFCQPLPNTIIGCDTNILGNISLCITNGTVGYSMGAYDSSENPFALSGNNMVIAGFSGGSTSLTCDQRIQTAITFKCDPYATWTAGTYGDASSHLVDFNAVPGDECLFTIEFDYDHVCTAVACEVPAPHNYDISTLVSADHWLAYPSVESCSLFFGTEIGTTGKCQLYMSFCKSLNGVGGCNTVINASVCITNGSVSYALGRYWSAINPIGALDTGRGIVYSNEGGSFYPACESTDSETGTNTIIQLQCGDSPWSYSNGVGDVSNYLLDLTQIGSNCLIFADFTYSGSCVGGSSGSDVGWVGLGLVLAVLFIAAAYLIIGSIYGITQGRTGCPDMLPNLGFWKAFFASARAGVIFSLNVISCGYCFGGAGAKSGLYDEL